MSLNKTRELKDKEIADNIARYTQALQENLKLANERDIHVGMCFRQTAEKSTTCRVVGLSLISIDKHVKYFSINPERVNNDGE